MEFPASRRRFLRFTAAGSTLGLAGCEAPDTSTTKADAGSPTAEPTDAESPTDADRPLPESVGLETLASGFRAPLDVAFVPDADQQYVADQVGVIHVRESGSLRDRPLLDLRETVEYGGEMGLLGIALHPDFAANRRLFVRYSAPPRAGTPSNYSHTFVLAEFEVTADGRRAKPESERAILEIPEPQSNHNAGAIAFGPDGHLYVAVGDGGAGGDQGTGHVSDWYDKVAGGNGQDVTENLLGGILRIDVDRRDAGAYGIPDDNPLVGKTGLDEYYAWGFRNPWRMSFDGTDFYVGDVGQNRYEEVDLVVKGGNYGWNVKEGTHCYNAVSCPDRTPASVRGGEPLRDPVIEYPHSGAPVSGISVIGGYVYRGSAVPSLRGAYVFGDWQAGGELFVATPADDGLWPTRTLAVTDGGKARRVLGFGRDDAGEIYVLSVGDTGGLHRIVPA